MEDLPLGTNRRSLLMRLLGLSGASLGATAIKRTDIAAARRPTPTAPPITCPGSQFWNGTECVCPSGRPCGPECCADGVTCCDNACCTGTCFAEEQCCPAGSVVCDGNCSPGDCCGNAECASKLCVEGTCAPLGGICPADADTCSGQEPYTCGEACYCALTREGASICFDTTMGLCLADCADCPPGTFCSLGITCCGEDQACLYPCPHPFS